MTLPLTETSIAEKIAMMEELWSDLSSQTAEYSAPDWHGRLLAERKYLAEASNIGFTDWEAAKNEIQDRIR